MTHPQLLATVIVSIILWLIIGALTFVFASRYDYAETTRFAFICIMLFGLFSVALLIAWYIDTKYRHSSHPFARWLFKSLKCLALVLLLFACDKPHDSYDDSYVWCSGEFTMMLDNKVAIHKTTRIVYELRPDSLAGWRYYKSE